MMRGRRVVDLLWLPLVALLLLPVGLHVSHRSVPYGGGVQGPLIPGRAGLDSLLADAVGRKPVIVNLWATWCAPCVAELPRIDRVYGSMDGAVLAVAVDIGDPDSTRLLAFREEVSLSMPMVWLDAGEAAALKEEWGLPDVLPVTVFLDAGGRETERALGSHGEEYFREAVLGAAPPDTAASPAVGGLHVTVSGDPSDPLTAALLETAVSLAGEEGVDFYDPSDPDDLAEMESLYLPLDGSPFAQPCVGSACGRICRTAEDLSATVEGLVR